MPFRIQHRVGVKAAAPQLWEILADLEAWTDWNPFYTKAEGKLSIGTTLVLTRAMGEAAPQTVSGRVVDWVPDSQILWSRPAGLLAKATGFVEIEVLSEEGCILSVGELFEGLGADYTPRSERRAIQAGCVAMCDAGKARAEAAWEKATPDYQRSARAASLVLLNTGDVDMKIKPPDPVMTTGLRGGKRK